MALMLKRGHACARIQKTNKQLPEASLVKTSVFIPVLKFFSNKSNWFQLTVTVNEKELIHDTIFTESPANQIFVSVRKGITKL